MPLGLPSRDFYLNPDKFRPQMMAYRNLLESLAKLVAEDAGIPAPDFNQTLDEILYLEMQIAKVREFLSVINFGARF